MSPAISIALPLAPELLSQAWVVRSYRKFCSLFPKKVFSLSFLYAGNMPSCRVLKTQCSSSAITPHAQQKDKSSAEPPFRCAKRSVHCSALNHSARKKGCTSSRSRVQRTHDESQYDQQSLLVGAGESHRRRWPCSECPMHFPSGTRARIGQG